MRQEPGPAPAGTVLVLGYGNPGRQDDGLGPAAADRIAGLGLKHVDVDSDFQPAFEDALEMMAHERSLFIDAAAWGPAPFFLRRVQASPALAFTSHLVRPEAVLALCQRTWGRVPETWQLGIRGYCFGCGEAMSPRAQENLKQALSFIELLLRQWKGEAMNPIDKRRKTILVIDDDVDFREAIRIILESSGYAVGEAANGEEGLAIAKKIKPDAILVDMMMETVDAGSRFSTLLKESGATCPIYLISSVGDAVDYNLDLRELGLTGIFQKPIDHDVLLATLRAKLK